MPLTRSKVDSTQRFAPEYVEYPADGSGSRILRTVAEGLNVQPGEGTRILLLGGYSFFGGFCLAYFISLANALFLVEFGVDYLPHGYIVTGGVGYIVGLLLSASLKRLSLIKLQKGLLFFLLFMALLFRISFWFSSSKWLALGMFVSIGPYITLIYFVFRSLAGRLFDIRQSKRLYGLISTGDVLSSILGFFSVPIFLRVFPVSVDLLWICAASLLFSLFLLRSIETRFGSRLADPGSGNRSAGGSPQKMFGNRYFILIYLLAGVTVFGFYTIDYTFLMGLRLRFPDSTRLAQFIGLFYGLIRIIELLLKTFLSARLISQYGLKFGLLVLPVLVLFCTFLSSLATLLAAGDITTIFLLLALNKLVERVAAKSLQEPSFGMLYQPVASEQRLSLQAFVDGRVQPAAASLAGFTLLLLSWIGSIRFTLGFLSVVFAGWVVMAILVYKEYRKALDRNLQTGTEKDAPQEVISHSEQLLLRQLEDLPPEAGLSVMDLLEDIAPGLILTHTEKLVCHRLPEIRVRAWQWVGKYPRPAMLNVFSRLADREDDPAVVESAQGVIALMKSLAFDRLNQDTLSRLARSSISSERCEAARALADRDESDLLLDLLADNEPEVRRVALVGCGSVNDTAVNARIVAQLQPAETANAAVQALRNVGESAFPALEASFSKRGQDFSLLERIVRVYAIVGGAQAMTLLAKKIDHPNKTISNLALAALAASEERADPEHAVEIRRQIETTVENSAWAMAAVLDLGESDLAKNLGGALGREIDGNRERIFTVMSLIYDPKSVGLVRKNFKSGSADGKTYALELLEAFVDTGQKEILFPILEDLTLAQRLRRLELPFPQQRLPMIDRVRDIINSDASAVSRWTRVCAIETLYALSPDCLFEDVVAQLFSVDPVLRETAAHCIQRTDPDDSGSGFSRWADDVSEPLLKRPAELDSTVSSLTERVDLLRMIPIFADIREPQLVDLAVSLKSRVFEADEEIVVDGKIHILVEGSLQMDTGDHLTILGDRGDLVGLGSRPEIRSLHAVCRSEILILDRWELCNYAAGRPELGFGLLDFIAKAAGATKTANPSSLRGNPE